MHLNYASIIQDPNPGKSNPERWDSDGAKDSHRLVMLNCRCLHTWTYAHGEFEANDGMMAQVRQECDDCDAVIFLEHDVVLDLWRKALRCELGLLPKRFLSAVSQLWVAITYVEKIMT